MVTLMILTTGIVMIYKVFLLSLDRQRYLLHRLYANNILDRRIAEVQHSLKAKGVTTLEQKEVVENAVLHNKEIPFTTAVAFQNVADLENLYQMNIGISWLERGHVMHLARSVYICGDTTYDSP